MWLENRIFREDLEQIANSAFIPWDQLRRKTVLVTGATGLIGSTLVSALLYAGKTRQLDLKVCALVRSEEKARAKFAGALAESCPLTFAVGSVDALPEIDGKVDYIVHAASPTASAFFVQHPVDTVRTAVLGTENMLRLAQEKGASGFVYLSSMEVYGAPAKAEPIREDYPTTVNTMAVRSCYPTAKLMCENLCVCYGAQYGVPAKVVRLAQTFGAGVLLNDNRVFAQFARAAMEREPIVLQTTGESSRAYLYTADAAAAILTVLLKGVSGEAYNAANAETYCSIVEMAHMVADAFADGDVRMELHDDPAQLAKYSPVHHLMLNADKLCALGWRPTHDLKEMYTRMIDCGMGQQ